MLKTLWNKVNWWLWDKDTADLWEWERMCRHRMLKQMVDEYKAVHDK